MSVPVQPPENEAARTTLLFVDDERRVLTSMSATFRRDYRVFVADNGVEALAIIERDKVDVVISDQRMPGMSGVELLATVKSRSPATVRILLTGYADLEAIEASINDGEVFRYLMKPCPPDTLKDAVSLAAHAARVEEISQPREAKLIMFPGARQIDEPARSTAAEEAADDHAFALQPILLRKPAAARARDVDIMVLTPDADLYGVIRDAVKGVHRVHHSASIEVALATITIHPVGVLVCDSEACGQDVIGRTELLKREVPGLVTIVASVRSDAQSLISMINNGRIFRFLLKPVSRGQCVIWLNSAAQKFAEQRDSQRILRRGGNATDKPGQSGILRALADAISRIRSALPGG